MIYKIHSHATDIITTAMKASTERSLFISSRLVINRFTFTSGNSELIQNKIIEKEAKFEEVRFPLPWKDANIAGKWWGPKDKNPVICIHGYQVEIFNI